MLWPRLAVCGLISSIALGASVSFPASADEKSAAAPGVRSSSDWPLERVTLDDGKSYQGLVESENAAGIEFVEVRRPRGKPMFLVVRFIDRKNITELARLETAEQKQLRARLQKYKQRALIDARRMDDLPLTDASADGKSLLRYQSRQFSLESTANDAMTRQSIVRLEQIFAAYRQFFPPRSTSAPRVHIRIFGDSEEYRRALLELGLPIKNPAVYLADRNLILAGSDMNRFDAELAQVKAQHKQVRQQLDALLAEMPARIKQLGEQLKQNEVPAAERQKVLVAEQKKWEDQRKAARRKMTTLDRKNGAKFNEVTAQMFARLAHEAFHAYLESFVYPRQSYDVPRWLNEGLAQVFEAALVEDESLRIDAPNAAALARLQSDLQGESPLELQDLLNAGSETFLAAHGGDGQAASRSYYYSWGLAYFLVFDQGILGTPRLATYLSPAAAAKPPVERFETLVGEPLPAFEKRWRKAMLNLQAGS